MVMVHRLYTAKHAFKRMGSACITWSIFTQYLPGMCGHRVGFRNQQVIHARTAICSILFRTSGEWSLGGQKYCCRARCLFWCEGRSLILKSVMLGVNSRAERWLHGKLERSCSAGKCLSGNGLLRSTSACLYITERAYNVPKEQKW